MANAEKAAEGILELAKRLSTDERRRVVEELLAELDQGVTGEAQVLEAVPFPLPVAFTMTR